MTTALVGLCFTLFGALLTLGFGFIFTYCAVSLPLFSSKCYFSVPDKEKQKLHGKSSYLARFRFGLRFFSYHKIRVSSALAFVYSKDYKDWIALGELDKETLSQCGYGDITLAEISEGKDGQEAFGIEFDRFYAMPAPLDKETLIFREKTLFAPCFVLLEINTVSMLLCIAMPDYNANNYSESSPFFVGGPVIFSALSKSVIEEAKAHASSRFNHLDSQFIAGRRAVTLRRMR